MEGTATAPSPTDVARRRLCRVTGIAGLAIVLLFVPALAGPEEPTFDATAAEIRTYFRSINSPLAQFGSFIFTVGLVAFLWVRRRAHEPATTGRGRAAVAVHNRVGFGCDPRRRGAGRETGRRRIPGRRPRSSDRPVCL